MGKVIKKTRAELRQEKLRDHDGLTKAQAIKLELVDEDYTPKKPKKPKMPRKKGDRYPPFYVNPKVPIKDQDHLSETEKMVAGERKRS